MCGYFCILFIEFMLKGKTLNDFTNLFSPNGLISSTFSLVFCLSSGIIKKLREETKLRKEKHNRLLHLAKNKLDCAEMFLSKSVMNYWP